MKDQRTIPISLNREIFHIMVWILSLATLPRVTLPSNRQGSICFQTKHFSVVAVDSHISEQIEAAKQKEVSEVNLSNLAPRKSDW